MQSLPNVYDSVGRICFSTGNYIDVGDNNGMISLHNYYEEQIVCFPKPTIIESNTCSV